jgi:hypothetical protein
VSTPGENRGYIVVSRFYVTWKIDPVFTPRDPRDRQKLWLSLLEMAQQDLESGCLVDWGVCRDANEGYAFAETDEETIRASMLKWLPYISFDVRAVNSVDRTITTVKMAATAGEKSQELSRSPPPRSPGGP